MLGCIRGSTLHAQELYWGPGRMLPPLGWLFQHGCNDIHVCCVHRESNTGIPGVWVFHVGSTEHVEPGGGQGAAPAVPQSPFEHPNPGMASYPHPLSGHTPMAQRPSHGSHGGPVLLGFVPGRRDTQERSRWLQPRGDGGTGQSFSANPSSYSSGQHGVGVEEDVHFNPDGERGQ